MCIGYYIESIDFVILSKVSFSFTLICFVNSVDTFQQMWRKFIAVRHSLDHVMGILLLLLLSLVKLFSPPHAM